MMLVVRARNNYLLKTVTIKTSTISAIPMKTKILLKILLFSLSASSSVMNIAIHARDTLLPRPGARQTPPPRLRIVVYSDRGS